MAKCLPVASVPEQFLITTMRFNMIYVCRLDTGIFNDPLVMTHRRHMVSGDGSALHIHSNPFGHKVKDADTNDLTHRYTAPDADIGWDSDLGVKYFGYTLYDFPPRYVQTIKMDRVRAEEVINRTVVHITKVKRSHDLRTASGSSQPDDESEADSHEPVTGDYVCNRSAITFFAIEAFQE